MEFYHPTTAHPDERRPSTTLRPSPEFIEGRSEEGSQKKMESQRGYFYILTNKGNNVLYTGSTENLINRVMEHRKGYQKGFTQKYRVNRLVYYEISEHVSKARDYWLKGFSNE